MILSATEQIEGLRKILSPMQLAVLADLLDEACKSHQCLDIAANEHEQTIKDLSYLVSNAWWEV